MTENIPIQTDVNNEFWLDKINAGNTLNIFFFNQQKCLFFLIIKNVFFFILFMPLFKNDNFLMFFMHLFDDTCIHVFMFSLAIMKP